MKYHYFICFFSSKNDTNKFIKQSQISNCEVVRNKKITNYNELVDLAKQIELKKQLEDVVIVNYILLKRERTENA